MQPFSNNSMKGYSQCRMYYNGHSPEVYCKGSHLPFCFKVRLNEISERTKTVFVIRELLDLKVNFCKACSASIRFS